MGAHFVIVPFVIGKIGLPAFGHAGLIIASWAPLTLIGTVIGQAATREIAAQTAHTGNDGSGQPLRAAALWLCITASGLFGTAFVAAVPHLLAWLDPMNLRVEEWRLDVLALAPGWAAQQVFIVLQGLAAAKQDFRLVAKLTTMSAVASLVCTTALTKAMPSPTGYLLGISCGFILAAGFGAWFLREPERHPINTRGTLRRGVMSVVNFGRWQVVAQLAGTLGNQIDRYVLATLTTPIVIGQFNAASRLQEAAYVGVVKAAEVLFPRFGASADVNADQRLRLYLLSSWVVMLFSGLVHAPIIALAEPLMRMWTTAETARGGSQLLQTLASAGLIGSGSSVFSYYLMGMGQNKPLAMLSVIYSILTIALSIVVLQTIGPMAAGLGLALASVVRLTLALAWSKRHCFPQARWTDLLVSTISPLIVSLGLGWVLAAWWPIGLMEAWWQLCAAALVVALIVSLAVVASTASSVFGREMLATVAQRLGGALKRAP
jgi:O-antigen/teichoic acid export membrane protein